MSSVVSMPRRHLALLFGSFVCLGLSACAGGSHRVFDKGDEPQVEFFQLDVVGRVQRTIDPADAVRAYLKITNRTDSPIELYRVRLALRGSIVARTEQARELRSQQIPSQDARIVRVLLTLQSAENPSSSTGPLVPRLRGQLSFRTPRGEMVLPVDEQLTEIGDEDADAGGG